MTPRTGRLSWTTALTAVLLLALSATAVASGPAPKKGQAKFEQEFLTMTIDHHFAGVKMGEICVEKNVDPRLDEVCSDIIANQSAEIEEMRGYLRQWYGQDKEPMLDESAQQDLAELRETEPGEEFDVLVSRMFIEHHRIQIRNSQKCLKKAFHPELRDLCRRQIEAQSREIEVFEAVIASYEDGDRGGHRGHGHGQDSGHGHSRGNGHKNGRGHK